MNITVNENAVPSLKDMSNNTQTLRIFLSGANDNGPTFGVVPDEKNDRDLECEVNGIKFLMDKEDYKRYGDVSISHNGYGIKINKTNPSMNEFGGFGTNGAHYNQGLE